MKETQFLNLNIFQEESEWLVKMSDASTARLVRPAVVTSDFTHGRMRYSFSTSGWNLVEPSDFSPECFLDRFVVGKPSELH